MKRLIMSFALCGTLATQSLRADEGMWLMQQIAGQYETLQRRGVQLAEYDIYNPHGTSLKDAVVRFGQGCTGEVISNQGLVLTNHHCGYDAIRGLSSVESNYLRDGFWAQSLGEELPAKGLTITFVDKIEDVTDYVKKELRKIKDPNDMSYLSPSYLAGLASKRAGKYLPKGVQVEIKAFYNGNRYLMFTSKVYRDIRFVGAPSSSIGKFGADTDNWAYPRHTGDFSLFRIYADANGNPADYSPSNVPLRPKRWLSISTGGVKDGDLAMIMGFSGRTNRFYLPEEVEEWRSIDNDIRIKMRAIRQKEMLREMLADPAIDIKYASKYATSQNGYKRAIGANWGIERNKLANNKAQLMQGLLSYSKNDIRYLAAIDTIRRAIVEREALRKRLWYLVEGPLQAIELVKIPRLDEAKKVKQFFADTYDARVDKLITLAVLQAYCKALGPQHLPSAIRDGLERFASLEQYVDELYKSDYATAQGAEQALHGKPQNTEANKLVTMLGQSLMDEYKELREQLAIYDNPIDRARRTYVGGLLEQYGDDKLWPDANSTLRFTYGNVKGYEPRDGVSYKASTYLDGVMEKEDPKNWEFVVAPRLKELYQKQSYGKQNRWAEKDDRGHWRMPVNFIATTHTTGGNSGSPVLDAKGRLIGINFDRTWEGVGGDIQYLPEYQRSIICDIRYILMIIEEIGQCHRLLDEMTID